jgi:hypothetical protein
MIREAKRNRAKEGVQAVFIRQDMRTLRVPGRVRLVTSMFDTLNHLASPAELLATFTRVRSVLLSGGYFMFDLNNERCYRTLWTQNEAVRHSDFTLLLENSYDAVNGRARSLVTLTPHDGGDSVTETVEERLFHPAQVHALLEQAGFQVCLSEDFAFPDVPEAGMIKTWWVAQRPSRERKRSSDI